MKTDTKSRRLPGITVNPAWATLPMFDRTGWKHLAFGEFAESIGERAEPKDAQDDIYVGLEHLDSQCLHIRRWGKGSDVIGGKLRFGKGDIIFGKRRAYQRKLAVAEFDGICSAHALVVRAKPDKVLPEFLPFLMMSDRFMNRAVEISVGSLSPTINWSTLKLQKFDLPSIEQQRRIAEILWAVDEAKSSQENLGNELRALHEAMLVGEFSTEVNTKNLSDVLSYASDGPFGSKLKTEHYAGSGARVIRLHNIGDGAFDSSDEAFIADKYFDQLKRYEVCANDVIVAGLGDETHPVGRAALVPTSLGRAVNKADCFCLRARPELIDNAYLVYFLNSGPGNKQVQSKAQGTTRLRINVGNLKTIRIPVPPLSDQARFVARVQEVEGAAANVEASMRNDASLIDAILNQVGSSS